MRQQWSDAQGDHWTDSDGRHWLAVRKPSRPDWTREQEQAAQRYLIIGRLVVALLAALEILIIALTTASAA